MSLRSSLRGHRRPDHRDDQILLPLLILVALVVMAVVGLATAVFLGLSGEYLAVVIVALGCAVGIAIILCAANEVA